MPSFFRILFQEKMNCVIIYLSKKKIESNLPVFKCDKKVLNINYEWVNSNKRS